MNSENSNQNPPYFPDDAAVLVRYPLPGTSIHDYEAWDWLPGSIVSQCGPEEWSVVVEVDALGVPDPDDPDALLYPLCFRCVSELRAVTEKEWWERRRELANG